MNIGGVDYIVPAPEGYCAGGAIVDAYLREFGDALKKANALPSVMLLRCGADELADDYFTVRTFPVPAMTLEAFLTRFKANSPAAQANLADGKLLNDRLREASGSDETVDNSPRPVGTDDTCGYVVGAMRIEVSGDPVDMTIVGCATVIDGQLLDVTRYRAGTDVAEATAGMPQVKGIAQAIRPAKQAK